MKPHYPKNGGNADTLLIQENWKVTPWLILLCFCLLKGMGQTTLPAGNRKPLTPADGANMNNTARRFLFSNTDSSIEYGQRGLLLARKTENPKLEGEACYLLGGNYWIMGDYAKALQNILQSLQIYESLHDRTGIADDYRALASIYRD